MEASIVKIGNSKGLIIPSRLLKLLDLKEKVIIDVVNDKLIITPAKGKPRQGWEEQIKREIEKDGQPEQLIPNFINDEENGDWEW